MKYVSNERGNSVFYIIWLLGISAVIFVIVINIAKVYVVKQQASTATQQAAFAGTIVLLEVTQEGIENFDSDLTKSATQKYWMEESPFKIKLMKKWMNWSLQDIDLQLAYIKAYNEVLPEKIKKHPQFKKEMKETFQDSDLSGKLLSTVQSTIMANEANAEDVEVSVRYKMACGSTADATYKTITDGTYLKSFTSDIKAKRSRPIT